MLDVIVVRHKDLKVLQQLTNVKLDTAAREFMVACAVSLREGWEIEIAIRPTEQDGP